LIFQHGLSAADMQAARKLALRALEENPDYRGARWLAAAALDRELMLAGKPQKYGTQYRRARGRWELYPVDPATTDAERQQWGVPSIAEAQGIPARPK
jgi:hypothetical protein